MVREKPNLKAMKRRKPKKDEAPNDWFARPEYEALPGKFWFSLAQRRKSVDLDAQVAQAVAVALGRMPRGLYLDYRGSVVTAYEVGPPVAMVDLGTMTATSPVEPRQKAETPGARLSAKEALLSPPQACYNDF